MFGQLFFFSMKLSMSFSRFLVPISSVICNDITAYIFGFFFGRTPLIKVCTRCFLTNKLLQLVAVLILVPKNVFLGKILSAVLHDTYLCKKPN